MVNYTQTDTHNIVIIFIDDAILFANNRQRLNKYAKFDLYGLRANIYPKKNRTNNNTTKIKRNKKVRHRKSCCLPFSKINDFRPYYLWRTFKRMISYCYLYSINSKYFQFIILSYKWTCIVYVCITTLDSYPRKCIVETKIESILLQIRL